jgi:hypothetical protein
MKKACNAPARREPCRACGGSRYVTIALRNDQTRTDQVLTQTCIACLPNPGTPGRAGLVLPRTARPLLFTPMAWCASGGAALVLSLWLAGTALGLAWLIVTAVIFLATAAACKAAARRARRAVL